MNNNIETAINNIDWKATNKNPAVIAEGVLHFDNTTFRVMELENGDYVFDGSDVEEYIAKMTA
jgi:hypothetical protein